MGRQTACLIQFLVMTNPFVRRISPSANTSCQKKRISRRPVTPASAQLFHNHPPHRRGGIETRSLNRSARLAAAKRGDRASSFCVLSASDFLHFQPPHFPQCRVFAMAPSKSAVSWRPAAEQRWRVRRPANQLRQNAILPSRLHLTGY